MMKRWLRYVLIWVSCLVFYFAYRQWMAWVVLLSVSLLPLLSLAVSLPAMLLARMRLSLPKVVVAGTALPLDIGLDCPLPLPVWKVRIEVRHAMSGEVWRLKPLWECPTEDCGALYFHFSRGRVYDYMGLFCLPCKPPADCRLMVRPQQLRPRQLPDPEKNIVTFWKPKAGGGFAENHELRLYRPGDSLRQIHWKLSGKTGQLIYREPMELANNHLLLRMVHGGSQKQINTKLGNLVWLGLYLYHRGLKFDVLVDTLDGQKQWHIRTKQELWDMMDILLCMVPMEEMDVDVPATGSSWQYYIGGGDDETQ